jgi:PhnB protein
MATKAAKPIPDGYRTVTPHLMLENTAQAIEWYKRAFGATEKGRHLGPDGKVMHAVIQIGDSLIIMNDVMHGQKGPQGYGGSPASLWLYVDNSDEIFNRAVAAGAKVMVPLGDQFWGDRGGALTDPAGYSWWIATRKEDVTPQELEQRANDFFKQQMAQPAGR